MGFVICYVALLLLEYFPSHTLMYIMVISQGLLGYGLASIYGAVTADIFWLVDRGYGAGSKAVGSL